MALLFLFAITLPAQTTSSGQAGSVTGTVTSSTGTPIANATIELENVSTSARMTATSDAQGNYRFDNVTSGTYRMHTSTAQGIGTPSADILVDATRAKTVNITMTPNTPGTTTTALITVEETKPVPGLESPQIRSAWNTRYIEYIPEANFMDKNGEHYGAYNLSLQNYGVANANGIGRGRGPIVGGQPPTSNNFMIDGVDNNNRANPGPLVYVSNEATSEFVAYQNQFAPEYGHATGGQFNSLIRTGTNQVHGTLYWYLMNRELNAQDRAFSRQGLSSDQRYDQNRLGASLGLPIIPNSLFFFGNFEYIPLGVSAQPVQPVYGPTAAGFATLGRMSGISRTNLGVLQQYLPAAENGTSFTTVNGQQIPIGPLAFNGKNWQNSYNGTGAIDWKIGNSDNLRARYVQNDNEANSAALVLPAFQTGVRDRAILANISEYHNLGARGINELRLGYNRYSRFLDNPSVVYPGLSVFPNISVAQDLNLQLGQGFLGIGSSGLNTYQLADNVNLTFGRHTVRFGADARRYVGPLNFSAAGYGNYSFSNLQRFLSDQAPDIYGSRTYGNLTYSGNQWNAYGYVNDSWRIAPTVNINLGVRYEYVTIPSTLQLQGLNSFASVPGVLEFNEPSTQKYNFAPRVGIAFAPTSMRNTVFRAGFGMNYDAQSWTQFLPSVPPGITTTQYATTVTPFLGFFGSGALVQNYPYNVFTPTVTPEQARAATSTYIQDQKLPYTMQWNANIQQSIGRFVLDVGYLGVKGVHLPVQDVLNRSSAVTGSNALPLFYSQPTQAQLNGLTNTLTGLQSLPNNSLASAGFTNPIFTVLPDGRSWYNGLLVEGRQRFSGGFQMKADYTWSHLIDDLGGPNLAGGGMLNWANWRTDRHTSIYDRRHVASLTALWDVGAIGPHSFNWVRDIVANLTVSGTYTYQSPAMIPITSGLDAGLGGGFAASGVFVNPNGTMGVGSGVSPLRNSSGQVVGYMANNPNAQFIAAGAGQFPNGGNAYFPGMNPTNNFNAAVYKRFGIRDRFALEFHGEAYNLLNHAQYVPGSLVGIGYGAQGNNWNFLVPGNPAFGDPSMAFSSNPRQLQVGVRVQF